jgi:aerobic-type carbon monoxide dehydrogenase small subunit (CoxS/CutS family)
VNGQAVRLCIRSGTDPVPEGAVAAPAVGSVGSQPIKTIEGLANGEELHPIQQAWIDLDVASCGFCQPGQIMRALALIAAHPNPTDQQIDDAMKYNVCRCGTYVRIRAAIKAAALAMQNG